MVGVVNAEKAIKESAAHTQTNERTPPTNLIYIFVTQATGLLSRQVAFAHGPADEEQGAPPVYEIPDLAWLGVLDGNGAARLRRSALIIADLRCTVHDCVVWGQFLSQELIAAWILQQECRSALVEVRDVPEHDFHEES